MESFLVRRRHISFCPGADPAGVLWICGVMDYCSAAGPDRLRIPLHFHSVGDAEPPRPPHSRLGTPQTRCPTQTKHSRLECVWIVWSSVVIFIMDPPPPFSMCNASCKHSGIVVAKQIGMQLRKNQQKQVSIVKQRQIGTHLNKQIGMQSPKRYKN